MVFTRSGRGGYPGNPGRGEGIRGQMTTPRRRRSLSATQFRFLWAECNPATAITDNTNTSTSNKSSDISTTCDSNNNTTSVHCKY
jgi:hypothetical protein